MPNQDGIRLPQIPTELEPMYKSWPQRPNGRKNSRKFCKSQIKWKSVHGLREGSDLKWLQTWRYVGQKVRTAILGHYLFRASFWLPYKREGDGMPNPPDMEMDKSIGVLLAYGEGHQMFSMSRAVTIEEQWTYERVRHKASIWNLEERIMTSRSWNIMGIKMLGLTKFSFNVFIL